MGESGCGEALSHGFAPDEVFDALAEIEVGAAVAADDFAHQWHEVGEEKVVAPPDDDVLWVGEFEYYELSAGFHHAEHLG